MRATCARRNRMWVVHSSNLCTEITLNTNEREIAVCNLGSVNLANHMTERGIDHEKLKITISTGMRMLDNVIDINYYAVPEARHSNLRHRPVGLGIMGFSGCLLPAAHSLACEEAVRFADESMEAVSFYAYLGSTDIAEERGRYATLKLRWEPGVLPQDSLELLAKRAAAARDRPIEPCSTGRPARAREQARHAQLQLHRDRADRDHLQHLRRRASIEPEYQNLYVKSNMSGEFTVVNERLSPS